MCPPDALPKLTKPGFVGFGSSLAAHAAHVTLNAHLLTNMSKRPPSRLNSRKASAAKVAVETDADRRGIAAVMLSPAFTAGLTISASMGNSLNSAGVKTTDVSDEIAIVAAAVSRGDMRRPEEMALAQASTLDFMFARLSELAFRNIQNPVFEAWMRLAFRAQSQCARTLETLATLKNPAIFARQVNVANQQVVANGTALAPSLPAPPAALSESAPIVRSADSEILPPARETTPATHEGNKRRQKRKRLD